MAICDIMKMFKSGEPNSPMILASASSFAACQDKEKDRKKETENGKEKAKDKEKEVLKDKAKDKEKGKEKAAKERPGQCCFSPPLACFDWLATWRSLITGKEKREAFGGGGMELLRKTELSLQLPLFDEILKIH